LEPGQTITLAVPEGLTLKAFDRGLIQSLAEYVPTADIKWIHGPDRSGTRLVMATERNLVGVKRVSRLAAATAEIKTLRENPIGSRPVPPPGLCECGKPQRHIGRCAGKRKPSKEPQLTKAADLLHAGGSLRDVSAATGLAKNTVLSVRRETPELPAPIMGAPSHKEKPSENRDGTIQPPVEQHKPQLNVATPVTIVTVEADAPKVDMTLSRAFELVIAEMESSLDSLRDDTDNADDLKDCIKSQEEIVGALREYHPSVMGMSATGMGTSIYERAMERAEAELHIINLEIQRLEMRRKALQPMLDAMKTSIHWERESR
jgi:hypothetical protein